MTRSTAWGAVTSGMAMTAFGVALMFATGACHHHHHGHGHHHHHHHKGIFALVNESGEAVVLEGDEPMAVGPGSAAEVELAEGVHDISVTYDDGSTDTFFDVAIEGDQTTSITSG